MNVHICFRTLADIDGDGQLKAEEFILAMHLTDMAKAGQPLPLTLPPELVPPSFRWAPPEVKRCGFDSWADMIITLRSPEASALV